jgi:hypothetical protein
MLRERRKGERRERNIGNDQTGSAHEGEKGDVCGCVCLGKGEEITLQEWEAVKVFYLKRKGGRVETNKTGESARERENHFWWMCCEDNMMITLISRAGGR